MRKIAVFVVAFILGALPLNTQASLIAEDSFNYITGSLEGSGSSLDPGWSTAWQSDIDWDVVVDAGSLSYTDSSGNQLATSGNKVQTPADAEQGQWVKSYRTLETQIAQSTYPEVWISFLIDSYNVGKSWAGISLYQDSVEKLFIGQTGNTDYLGVQEWPSGNQYDTIESLSDPVFFVTQLVFGSPGSMEWTFWLNPDLNQIPLYTDAVATHSFSVDYIDTIRIAGQSEVEFDELRIGKTYGDVSPVPEPATMLLLGTGLVGLVGFRRKFRK